MREREESRGWGGAEVCDGKQSDSLLMCKRLNGFSAAGKREQLVSVERLPGLKHAIDAM